MKVISVTAEYEQPEDCCGRTGVEQQHLQVEICDGGGGPYAVIRTDRWALDADAVDAFAAELKRRIAEVPEN